MIHCCGVHRCIRCSRCPRCLPRLSQSGHAQVLRAHVGCVSWLRGSRRARHKPFPKVSCDHKRRVLMCLIRSTPDLIVVPLADDESE